MKAATLRTFTAAHGWMGVFCGGALFIAFLAGALTLFHADIQEWQQPAHQFVPLEAPGPEQLAQLQALIDDARSRGLEFDRGRMLVWLAGAHGPQAHLQWRAAGTRTPQALYEVAGEVVNPEQPPHSRMAEFLNRLHFGLGLPSPWGEYLMGVISLIYGAALLSGLVIHAPQLARNLFAVRPGRNRKRFLQDVHNVVGVLSFPFHLMYAFTGVFFTLVILLFAGMNYLAMDNTIGGFLKEFNRVVPAAEAQQTEQAMLPLAAVLERAGQEVPGLEAGLLVWEHYGDAAATVTVHGYAPRSLRPRSAVVLHGGDGTLLGRNSPEEAKPSLQVAGVITALHLGEFGGPAVQGVYFGLALLGCALFYSGNLLWVETRRRRSGPQSRAVQAMGRLTVGICLGSVLALAVLFLANLLLPLQLAGRADWEVGLFGLTLLAALGLVMRARPARAAVLLARGAGILGAFACGLALLHAGIAALPVMAVIVAVVSLAWGLAGISRRLF